MLQAPELSTLGPIFTELHPIASAIFFGMNSLIRISKLAMMSRMHLDLASILTISLPYGYGGDYGGGGTAKFTDWLEGGCPAQ
jgi:hypothetical protein